MDRRHTLLQHPQSKSPRPGNIAILNHWFHNYGWAIANKVDTNIFRWIKPGMSIGNQKIQNGIGRTGKRIQHFPIWRMDSFLRQLL